jgi:hypothetical protein
VSQLVNCTGEFVPQQFRVFWDEIQAQTNAFLATLSSDADLERVGPRDAASGKDRKLWEMMLTILGHSPGDWDLL